MSTLTPRSREALAVLGIFQRLGIPTDDIVMTGQLREDGTCIPMVMAKRPNAQPVAWLITFYGAAPSQDVLLAELHEAAEAWNRMTAMERYRHVEASDSRGLVVLFLARCAEQGIYFDMKDLN